MESRKLVSSMFLAISLPVALAGKVSAHQGDMIYPIYELPTSQLPSLGDDTLRDWDAVLPHSSLDHNSFVSRSDETGTPDPADLAWRVFLAWHLGSQRVYFAIERIDDEFVDGFMEGLVHLVIDGDHSGGPITYDHEDYSPAEWLTLDSVEAQWYLLAMEPSPGQPHVCSGGASRWAAGGPFAEVAFYRDTGDHPNYGLVEGYVTPWDRVDSGGEELSIRSELSADAVIGFGISVVDLDSDREWADEFVLANPSGPPEGGYSADLLVDGQLIPCNTGDCSGVSTAVSQDSWGRIKASFR